MGTQTATSGGFMLERISAEDAKYDFTTPTKRINDGDDLTFFLSSTAYRDLTLWLLQLNRSMFPTKLDGGMTQDHKLDSPPSYSNSVQSIRQLVSSLSGLIDQAPPDQGPRRFGNVAFRTWYRLVEEGAEHLITGHLGQAVDRFESREALKDELKIYLLGGFGSAQRLDYGTGHELSFLAFLGCLWKIGVFQDGEERAVVIGVLQPYLELIRRLVLTYTLEPAGSHGVWGLDDHSFVPYIFGAAQYGPPIHTEKRELPVPTEGSLDSAPSPTAVTDKKAVFTYQASNMYFSAIQFIYDVKRGPFWEHSPVLYDVSGIKDGWGKINKGMLKMYAAEVLGKFPVVQHFPFGSLFRWEADRAAAKGQSTEHARQQPKARSMDVPPAAPAATSGMRAPWAVEGPTRQLTDSGMPSTKAPWAAAGRGQQALVSTTVPGPRTSAPWTSSQRGPAPRAGRNVALPDRSNQDHG